MSPQPADERAFLDEAYHVERPGADLYVEQVGPTSAPPVYFLHGGPGYHAHAFRELVGDDLEGFRMIYADQRGGGRSYADQPFDLDVLADDVRRCSRRWGARAPASLATSPCWRTASGRPWRCAPRCATPTWSRGWCC